VPSRISRKQATRLTDEARLTSLMIPHLSLKNAALLDACPATDGFVLVL